MEFQHTVTMSRITFIILLSFYFASGNAFAQTPAEADTLFVRGDYAGALNAYENLSKHKSKETLYTFRIAVSAYETGDFDKAITHFEKSGNKYPQRNFYLGKLYFDRYQFENAVEAYESYLSSFSSDDENYPEAEKQLKRAKLGANLLSRVEDVEIVDSVVVDKSDFLSKIPMIPELGTLKQQQPDLGEKGKIDNMRYITQRGDRMYASEYLNGNSDLFTVLKLLDDWSEPQSLNDLNSEADENYPFLLQDGVTLYFASNGNASLGGYDMFITRLNTNDNTFLKPENIGMPFNSPYNDYMLVLDELRNVGWFVSDRFLPKGKVAVYQYIPNKEKKIIRTEDSDSLTNKAKITQFSGGSFGFSEVPVFEEKKISSSSLRIFINNKTTYSDLNEFKNNSARNHYFQAQKLTEEKQSIESELANLRKEYRTVRSSQRNTLSRNILKLEERLRLLPKLIEDHTKRMRNGENEILGLIPK